MDWVYIALGGACGALARYGITRWLGNKEKSSFPWGTWWVNVTGSFLLGWMIPWTVQLGLDADFALFVSVGVLGAYTTFSTFAVEVVMLWHRESRRSAIWYVMNSWLAGMIAAGLGLWIGFRAL